MGCSAVTSRMSFMHPSKSVSMLSTCGGPAHADGRPFIKDSKTAFSVVLYAPQQPRVS